MTTMAWTYVAYLAVCVGITIWVAQTLRKQGRVVLTDGQETSKDLSDAFSHLLVVGFYLVNLGFVALYLNTDGAIGSPREVFEAVSAKLGVVLLVLGALHLGNVFVLNKFRRRGAMEREQVPPVAPQGWTTHAAPSVPPAGA